MPSDHSYGTYSNKTGSQKYLKIHNKIQKISEWTGNIWVWGMVSPLTGSRGRSPWKMSNFRPFQVPHIAINACKFSTMEYVDIEYK